MIWKILFSQSKKMITKYGNAGSRLIRFYGVWKLRFGKENKK